MGCKQLFVNLGGSGGSVATGMLQIAGGVALDGTLRNVSDQNATDSPLQLSTNNVSIFSPSGAGNERRLIMDSGNDASAKIFSFRTGGLQRWALRVDGTESGSNAGGNLAIRRYNDAGTFISALLTLTRSTGVISITPDAATFSSGTNNRTYLDLSYTINTTGGTNTIQGLNINPTITSATGSTSTPLRIQRNGVTHVAFDTYAGLTSLGLGSATSQFYSLLVASQTSFQNNIIFSSASNFMNNNGMTFANNFAIDCATNILTITSSRIRLNGTTSAFPALKRNGITIEIRTADDSAYGNIDALRYFTSGTQGVSGTFTSTDGKTITATNGIITSIV